MARKPSASDPVNVWDGVGQALRHLVQDLAYMLSYPGNSRIGASFRWSDAYSMQVGVPSYGIEGVVKAAEVGRGFKQTAVVLNVAPDLTKRPDRKGFVRLYGAVTYPGVKPVEIGIDTDWEARASDLLEQLDDQLEQAVYIISERAVKKEGGL